jgi:hypothetical protein
MLGHQALELGGDVSVAAERQVDLGPLLDRREAELLEAATLDLGEALVGEVGQRRAAPQGQRLP